MDPSTTPLLSGSHNRPGLFPWLMLGIGGLCAAAALKFWFYDQRPDVAPYPAAAAGAMAAIFLLACLRIGRFRLYPDRIEGEKILLGRFRVPLDQVTAVRIEEKGVRLQGPGGATALFLAGPRPAELGGLLWFLSRHRALLPPELLPELMRPARLRRHGGVVREVTRHFFQEERGQWRAAFSDRGLLVSLGERHVFLPRQETVEVTGPGRVLVDLVLPITWSKRLKLTDAPSLAALPTDRLADAVLAADRTDPEKLGLLAPVAAELGGQVFEGPVDSDGALRDRLAQFRVVVEARERAGAAVGEDDQPSEVIDRRLSPGRLLGQLGIAAAMLGPGVGALLGASVLDDPGRQTPEWLLSLLGISGIVLVLIGGIWLFVGPTTMARANYCRACAQPVRTTRLRFALAEEERVLSALALDDPADLQALPGAPFDQPHVELLADYCPACRQVAQAGLTRVHGHREALLPRQTVVAPAAVAALIALIESRDQR